MLALGATTAACGDDTGHSASPAPESPAPGSARVVLISATAAGGDPETRATDVTDEADLTAYVEQFHGALARQVAEAAGRAGGGTLFAQVVSIGCDKPVSARLETSGDRVEMVPTPPRTTHRECLAPVTTVGLVSVPASQ